ncbi:AFG1 family ATPase [Enterobacter cloacae complex sp. I1]|uniref:cell division protein ZapE n=1 Tax=unclassified Enterobacter cloacae complex TaxID=2757714 RepID=UPI001868BE87|nr:MULTISPECIES: cell division protein ZapE [unclassified Enterobacter cloacae complex]MBE3465250.1 AFG1 family ATPase [Enterobacter cloacae complex sp. P20C]MBE3473542.1 AFG1 family ATPase [Enterobacter cloacae complex sp. P20B]MBE3495668.1 AFG1 family ATPase [Enterobacter cloacae complex sp. P17RS]MBE3507448.1 AFG1 family ATPase [Enterobacter cloacae complex sp. I10]MBE3525406.1 AFG1 family ATPase [Enterobacter cloacae complex sp. I9]
MQILSPASRYQLALNEGTHQPDDVQREAVNRLEMMYQALTAKPAEVEQSSGLKAAFGRLLGKKAPQAQAPVRGLYMWGGVGRGKTWLMDLFYLSLPGERKQRLHFHRFMLRVHEELTALQGKSDPLEIVADRFKAETDVLCFDEFFVSDITDAMLLGGLMKALFARGITLVATSNIPPDELYRNGLQRARFLPAIDAIKQHCDIMNVDAGVDYRLRTLTQAHLWLSPLNADTAREMDKLWLALAGAKRENAPTLEINHRPLPTLGVENQTLAVSFATLCVDARSQHDYIALSRLFHTVMMLDVPVMTRLMESEARRFIALVDEFYERHVKLVVSAEVPLYEVYQGERLKFEFQRCLSRLQEMQSEEYLKREHMP